MNVAPIVASLGRDDDGTGGTGATTTTVTSTSTAAGAGAGAGASYIDPMIDHLTGSKLGHWDAEVRTLASKSLGTVTVLRRERMGGEVLPSLLGRCLDARVDTSARHGAVLGVAEVLLALGGGGTGNDDDDDDDDDDDGGGRGGKEGIRAPPVLTDPAVVASVAELVPSMEKARMYRGRGGEDVRTAVMRLIECLSLARLPLTVRQQVSRS